MKANLEEQLSRALDRALHDFDDGLAQLAHLRTLARDEGDSAGELVIIKLYCVLLSSSGRRRKPILQAARL